YSSYTNNYTDAFMTERTIEYIKKEKPDFLFMHLDKTDNVGHHEGWMSESYLKAVSDAVECVKTVISELGDEYSVIVTSDHGGVGTDHGGDSPAERTIPAFFVGEPFEAGKELESISIMDIAPTIVKIMDVPLQDCWLGKPII
ncbi:MAG: alkaline phosphatase, partial [Clostridia bacterium]|nr:alkaline phosphatase [Clostridia bacterium]